MNYICTLSKLDWWFQCVPLENPGVFLWFVFYDLHGCQWRRLSSYVVFVLWSHTCQWKVYSLMWFYFIASPISFSFIWVCCSFKNNSKWNFLLNHSEFNFLLKMTCDVNIYILHSDKDYLFDHKHPLLNIWLADFNYRKPWNILSHCLFSKHLPCFDLSCYIGFHPGQVWTLLPHDAF